MPTVLLFWLIIALLFLIFEIGHPGFFFFLSFAIGACITGVASFWVYSYIWQALIFLIGSMSSFFIVQNVGKRLLPTHEGTRSNIWALEGKVAYVVTPIESHGGGYVKVGGETWAARAVDNCSLAIGVSVRIIAVKGAHLIVQEINK